MVRSLILSVVWLLLGIAGLLILKTRKTPVDILVGVPFLLIGGGLLINNLWTTILVAFSSTYNKGVCPICNDRVFKDHKRLKEILR